MKIAIFATAFIGGLVSLTIAQASGYVKNAVSYQMPVNAAGNVFAAGVGGLSANGGGHKPTVLELPKMRNPFIMFTSVLGTVSCCGGGSTFNGPEGGANAGGSTDIASSGGISGIIDHNRTMFLIGVFVGSPSPKAPGPERLDVTYAAAKTDVYPKLDQTFYIGNGKVLKGGKTYQRIHVPDGANHLVLGFADSGGFHGAPGAYDDDVGELHVKLTITPQY
ncbi:MAG: hypothetical protein JO194_01345 [Candidatus Eremiobacteraeota bacterium]|nr:hypothetical protein [Candidatus Eremiobacteraeota bacterium]